MGAISTSPPHQAGEKPATPGVPKNRLRGMIVILNIKKLIKYLNLTYAKKYQIILFQ